MEKNTKEMKFLPFETKSGIKRTYCFRKDDKKSTETEMKWNGTKVKASNDLYLDTVLTGNIENDTVARPFDRAATDAHKRLQSV